MNNQPKPEKTTIAEDLDRLSRMIQIRDAALERIQEACPEEWNNWIKCSNDVDTLKKEIKDRCVHIQPPHSIQGELGASVVYYEHGPWKPTMLVTLLQTAIGFARAFVKVLSNAQ